MGSCVNTNEDHPGIKDKTEIDKDLNKKENFTASGHSISFANSKTRPSMENAAGVKKKHEGNIGINEDSSANNEGSFVNKNEGVSDYDSCFSALAGNAFTGSVVAAVLISVLANLTPGQVAYANGRYREPIKRKSTPDSDIEDLLTRRRVRWVASSSSSAPPP